VEGQQIFLGSPRAAAEFVILTSEQDATIAALNDASKTVFIVLMDDRLAEQSRCVTSPV
jgi:Zn2+/Cd2+-exporting ATPase